MKGYNFYPSHQMKEQIHFYLVFSLHYLTVECWDFFLLLSLPIINYHHDIGGISRLMLIKVLGGGRVVVVCVFLGGIRHDEKNRLLEFCFFFLLGF